jgi:hypothetical protein
MGTSRRRTPPAPVSARPPKGARTANRGMQKTRKGAPGFMRLADFFAVACEGPFVQAWAVSSRKALEIWVEL